MSYTILLLLSCGLAGGVVLPLACWSLLKKTCPSSLKGVPGPLPQSWLKGNLEQLFNTKGLPFHLALPDQYGGLVKVYGFFGDEQLYISDPKALHRICVTDQDSFEQTAVFTETNKIIFGPGLVSTIGEQHSRQRKIVNHVFSSTQLKQLVPVFYEISEKLVDVLSTELIRRSDGILDMSEWMCRVVLEAVGQSILGYSFDPLTSPYNNPYTSAVKDLIPTLFSLSLLRQFAPFLSRLGSPFFRRKLVEQAPFESVQKVKNMADVMYATAQDILQKRKEVLINEDISSPSRDQRADLVGALLRASSSASGEDPLSDDELIGQLTVMIFGAQDTTSSALSRILFMLSKYTDIQDKVREEIKRAVFENGDGNGHLRHGDLLLLPWLDAVIKESLRLYPPVPFVRRSVIKETVLPLCELSSPLAPKFVTVPAGTTIFIAIAGANRMESIWGADAKEWKPSRWMSGDDEMAGRLPGVYSGMMTFIGGPRSCIGYKFALLEMKILLAVLLQKFTFELSESKVVWNLSQIISPSVVKWNSDGEVVEEKGMPLVVKLVEGQ